MQTKTISDFNFNAWKKRYSDWNRIKYLRPTDVFRNQISTKSDKLTRREFIDGILSTSNSVVVVTLVVVTAAVVVVVVVKRDLCFAIVFIQPLL